MGGAVIRPLGGDQRLLIKGVLVGKVRRIKDIQLSTVGDIVENECK